MEDKKKFPIVPVIIVIFVLAVVTVVTVFLLQKRKTPKSKEDTSVVTEDTSISTIPATDVEVEPYASVLESFTLDYTDVGNVYSGTKNLSVSITNPSSNSYSFYVDVKNADGTIIATSSDLKPGTPLINLSLKETLPVGMYDMTLVFNIKVNDTVIIPYEANYRVCSYLVK